MSTSHLPARRLRSTLLARLGWCARPAPPARVPLALSALLVPLVLAPAALAAAPSGTPSGLAPPARASAPGGTEADPGGQGVPLGFDACEAPSLPAMAAWRASPFGTVGIYVGGANRACPDGNLSASWVRKVSGYGYTFIPTYVGRQAPCTDKAWATIDTAGATPQGHADATDAVNRLRTLGFGPGNPIYLDIEDYEGIKDSKASKDPGEAERCGSTVVRYVTGWVRTLHAAGYLAGVYSNASSGIRDLADARGSRRVALPDAIWIAQWDNMASVWDSPYVPNRMWAYHQRLKQFRGDHVETYGGVSLSIDSNAVDGPVAAPDPVPTLLRAPPTPPGPATPATPVTPAPAAGPLFQPPPAAAVPAQPPGTPPAAPPGPPPAQPPVVRPVMPPALPRTARPGTPPGRPATRPATRHH